MKYVYMAMMLPLLACILIGAWKQLGEWFQDIVDGFDWELAVTYLVCILFLAGVIGLILECSK
jgi:hypothetical protein